MKFLSKITCLVMALGLMVAFSSCSKDDDECYECDAITIAGIEFPEATFCVGDDDGNGGTYTEASLKAEVEAFEQLGGNCDKK